MPNWTRFVRMLAPATLLVMGGVAASGTTGALAYGAADQPLAQVEISGNCNNATLCPDLIGEEGGLWIWAELDQTPDPNMPGWNTTDYTISGCGHTVGAGGPGLAGAGGGPGQGDWRLVSSVLVAVNDGFLPMDLQVTDGSVDFNTPYYEILLNDGPPVAVPATQGHYSVAGLTYDPETGAMSTYPGISFQTEVAP